RDAEPDPGTARHRGAVRRARAEPQEGVPGDRRPGHDPGFRKGKVPSVVIDQRIGRGAVLNEAVQDAIPDNIVAAVREHEIRSLGRPAVEITELTDGEALRFTAE